MGIPGLLAILAGLLGAVFLYERHLSRTRDRWQRSVPLDTQIALLKTAGLELSPGIAPDALPLGTDAYERDPLRLLLLSYAGSIPDAAQERPICDRAAMIDMECIDGAGSYARLLADIARAGGVEATIGHVADEVDPVAGTSRLHYEIGGTSRRLAPALEEDWADPDTVSAILKDVEAQMSGRLLWLLENGQALGVFAISRAGATRISRLRPGLLIPATG
ncbi:hypothetical protein [Litorisediminicola beolgyonensis]|uniref:RING-type E3 ubiquitin transferase n=1 Tax=Litorisediminicola beolgyonensis TaxID=1173614 RepID=A0ABW3ZI19_9RHOB